jgi:hypothetical protein
MKTIFALLLCCLPAFAGPLSYSELYAKVKASSNPVYICVGETREGFLKVDKFDGISNGLYTCKMVNGVPSYEPYVSVKLTAMPPVNKVATPAIVYVTLANGIKAEYHGGGWTQESAEAHARVNFAYTATGNSFGWNPGLQQTGGSCPGGVCRPVSSCPGGVCPAR